MNRIDFLRTLHDELDGRLAEHDVEEILADYVAYFDEANGGRELVPTDWLKRAITPAVAIADGRRYGYHWYLGASMAGTPPSRRNWIGAIGWGPAPARLQRARSRRRHQLEVRYAS